ncbi:hypothetical protein QE379_000053 [Sphingomonas sp. SORGH_AS 879]|nr:hypothetical protein [Sphingomonas sp. SORGH_AS_0879]
MRQHGGGGVRRGTTFVAIPLHHRFAAVPLPVPGRISFPGETSPRPRTLPD